MTPSNTAPSGPAGRTFGDLFATPLPRGLRDEVADLPCDEVFARLGHCSGPVRLGAWECADAAAGPRSRTFRATLAFGDRITTPTASASGPPPASASAANWNPASPPRRGTDCSTTPAIRPASAERRQLPHRHPA